jgi:hypothetical protein
MDSQTIVTNWVTHDESWVSVPAVFEVPELGCCFAGRSQEPGKVSRCSFDGSLRGVTNCTEPEDGE